MLSPYQPRPDIAVIAELMGNTTRAAMISALAGDAVMPAGELASIAGVSRPTASEHLARLREHGLVSVERQGRHAYYRLSGSEVAEMVEALAVIAPVRPPTSLRGVRQMKVLSHARTCYKHLAGRLGVALADALCEQGLVRRVKDGLALDAARWDERGPLGLTSAVGPNSQPPVKGCVDWSERRHHLAGPLATALTGELFSRDWIARTRDHHRAVVVTAEGERGLAKEFGLKPL